MSFVILPLFNTPNYNYKSRVNGYTLTFTFNKNSLSDKYYLTISLQDGSVILQNKELSDGRQLFLNSNSPFFGYVSYNNFYSTLPTSVGGYVLSLSY